jgi:hypothetical protein
VNVEGERGHVARYVRHSAGQLEFALKTDFELWCRDVRKGHRQHAGGSRQNARASPRFPRSHTNVHHSITAF